MVTFASQGVSIVIQLASTVILARLLSPDDYGVIAMVMAITAFAGLFRDLGLSAAAIQKGDLTHAQMSNLFWLNVGMGTFLTIALATASPLVASFYGKPELVSLTMFLSLSFVIGALGTQHGALLQREMQFGRKAITGIVGSLVTLAVAATLAWQGHGYWALAWGMVSGSIVTTLLLFALTSFWPGLWTKDAGIGEMMKFGANVTAFDFVNYFHRNLDSLLIGRFWGPLELGLYSRAYALLMFPINAIRGPINAVAFPAMSRLKDQPVAYRAYYRKITHLLAFVSMPLTAFLCVASAPIIGLLLGDEWLGVSPIFSLLAITSFIQPVAGLRGTVLLSTGQGGRYVQWGIFNAICVSIGFLIGVQWGAMGIAISYAVVNYAILYPSLLLAFSNTPLVTRDFFEPILTSAAASLAAGLVCHFGAPVVSSQLPPVVEIALMSIVFGGSYLLFTALVPQGRQELRSVLGIFRRRQVAIA